MIPKLTTLQLEEIVRHIQKNPNIPVATAMLLITTWTDREIQDAYRAGNGLYDAIVRKLEPYFPKDTRDLDWDVLPSTIGSLINRLQPDISELEAQLHLGGMEGVTFTNYTVFRIDWRYMEVDGKIRTQDDRYITTAQCRVDRFKTFRDAIKFVKNNKHQIVVQKLITEPTYWYLGYPDTTETKPPILIYASKPGSTLVE